jgi:hypothetical protein
LPGGHERKGIKIHAGAGGVIHLADEVKLTGETSVGPGGSPSRLSRRARSKNSEARRRLHQAARA